MVSVLPDFLTLLLLFSSRMVEYLIFLVILATITLTFSLHNVILLFNFPPIILILAFPLLVFNSISITLLIPIIYPPPMSILPLVNGPPVMYPLSFNYAQFPYIDFGLFIHNSDIPLSPLSIPFLWNDFIDSFSTLYLCYPFSFLCIFVVSLIEYSSLLLLLRNGFLAQFPCCREILL